MCVFCAAIPAAASAGIALNNKQIQAKRQAENAGVEKPKIKPIMQVTAGVVVLLMVGSATYHTFTYFP
jgi:hypothetical protein